MHSSLSGLKGPARLVRWPIRSQDTAASLIKLPGCIAQQWKVIVFFLLQEIHRALRCFNAGLFLVFVLLIQFSLHVRRKSVAKGGLYLGERTWKQINNRSEDDGPR